MRVKTIINAVDAIYRTGAHKATVYLDPKFTVKATARIYRGKRSKNEETDIVLSIGRPNYKQRQFIKDCVKAGEPFPIKKIQLQFPPKKRK